MVQEYKQPFKMIVMWLLSPEGRHHGKQSGCHEPHPQSAQLLLDDRPWLSLCNKTTFIPHAGPIARCLKLCSEGLSMQMQDASSASMLSREHQYALQPIIVERGWLPGCCVTTHARLAPVADPYFLPVTQKRPAKKSQCMPVTRLMASGLRCKQSFLAQVITT